MSGTQQMQSEIRTARDWYWWLWLSPLLTLPTFVVIYFSDPGYAMICSGKDWRTCDSYLSTFVTGLIALLCSGLWHLLLLKPARSRQGEFVRWHGRQAMLLAAVRTALPAAALALDYFQGEVMTALVWSLVILLAVWLFGTLWGQRQASRGDCALMRWTGHGDALPLPVAAPQPPTAPAPSVAKTHASLSADALVEIVRFSHDPEQRRKALAELERLGLVETL